MEESEHSLRDVIPRGYVVLRGVIEDNPSPKPESSRIVSVGDGVQHSLGGDSARSVTKSLGQLCY